MNDPGIKSVKQAQQVELLERENHKLMKIVRVLAKRHYGDFPIPPPRLRLNVGMNDSAVNFLAQGMRSSTRVLQLFGDAPAGPILDWGCGSGRTYRWLLAYPAWREHYRGTDVDAGAIDWLARHGAQVKACAEFPPLPFAEESFVGLFSFSVLTHIHPKQHRQWYEGLRRVLRRGAIAYLTTVGPRHLEERKDLGESAHAELRDQRWLFIPHEGHYKAAAVVTEDFTRTELRDLFRVESYTERGYGKMDVYVLSAS